MIYRDGQIDEMLGVSPFVMDYIQKRNDLMNLRRRVAFDSMHTLALVGYNNYAPPLLVDYQWTPDRGQIISPLMEVDYPAYSKKLLDNVMRFKDWDTFGQVKVRPIGDGVQEYVLPIAHDFYKWIGEADRSIKRAWRLCNEPSVGIFITPKREPLNQGFSNVVRSNVTHFVQQECDAKGISFDDSNVIYLRHAATNFAKWMIEDYPFDDRVYLQFWLDGEPTAIVVLEFDDDQVYWVNTYINRTEKVIKLGFGNYTLLKAIEWVHHNTMYSKINLGLAYYEYKKKWKANLVWRRGLAYSGNL